LLRVDEVVPSWVELPLVPVALLPLPEPLPLPY
jgi:hypothetical protein